MPLALMRFHPRLKTVFWRAAGASAAFSEKQKDPATQRRKRSRTAVRIEARAGGSPGMTLRRLA